MERTLTYLLSCLNYAEAATAAQRVGRRRRSGSNRRGLQKSRAHVGDMEREEGATKERLIKKNKCKHSYIPTDAYTHINSGMCLRSCICVWLCVLCVLCVVCCVCVCVCASCVACCM